MSISENGRVAAKRILIVSDSVGTPIHQRGIFYFTTNLMRAQRHCGHQITLLVETNPYFDLPATERAKLRRLSKGGEISARLAAVYYFLSQKSFTWTHVWSNFGGRWFGRYLALPATIASMLSLRGARLILRMPVVLLPDEIPNDLRHLDFVPPGLDHLRIANDFATCGSVYSLAYSASMFNLGVPIIDARGYDLILVDTPSYFRYRKSPGAKVLTVVHDLIPLSDPTLHPQYRGSFAKKISISIAESDDFIYVSETTRKKFAEFFPQATKGKEGIILHPSLAEEHADSGNAAIAGVSSDGQQQSGGYFTVMVSDERRKNLENLVSAFAFLPQEIGLKVIGYLFPKHYWSSEKLARERASESLSAGRIQLLGYVSDAVKKRVIAGSIGVIVPSFAEGFGIPIVEGFLAHKPVFCSDLPVFREVAGESPFYFDPYSPRSIADAIKTYLNDPLKYQSRIAAAAVECRQRFGLARLVETVAANFGRASSEAEVKRREEDSNIVNGTGAQ
jgi:glycosyltransferase involved in cell wall biosynthesis